MSYPTTPPSYDLFKRDVIAIFADGDLRLGYDRMINHINIFHTEDGEPLTYSFIMSKFKACHQQWNIRYGAKAARGYISKEAELLRYKFEDFVENQVYLHEFVINTSGLERNLYIFGNFSTKYLDEQLKHFKKKIKDGRTEAKTKAQTRII